MPVPPKTATAFAPGRFELLGNHTDYNEGVVLSAAIHRGLTVTGTTEPDGGISIESALMGSVRIEGDRLAPQSGSAAWANYPLGVAHELRAAGIPVEGFSACVDGDLPAGNGLSSSAAFEVATAFFLLKLHDRTLPPLTIARLCQQAEHSFRGVRSGLLDQVSSIFGKADHVIFFDARTEEVRTLPFPNDLLFIITETGIGRELSHTEYNDRRTETAMAAKFLGISSLRDISSAQLAQNSRLDPLLRRRATHIVSENERVWRAVELLEAGDYQGLGGLMNESHDSSRANFENSSTELDVLVDIARSLPGVLGSRLTGAGFGGATLTLCRRSQADAIVTELVDRYHRRTGQIATAFVCRISNGAH